MCICIHSRGCFFIFLGHVAYYLRAATYLVHMEESKGAAPWGTVATAPSGIVYSSVIVRARADGFSETKQVEHREQLTREVGWDPGKNLNLVVRYQSPGVSRWKR